MQITCRNLLFVLLTVFCLFKQSTTLASEWVSVGGNVRFDNDPVCALVLVNGQTHFSCDGLGSYEMAAPVDENGMLTVMVFADGFAPYNQTVAPFEAFQHPISMRLDQGSPSLDVDASYAPAAVDGRFIVSGTVTVGTNPVCALVLANGQNIFSCQESIGNFSLDVPVDQDGNIVLMLFAAGFKPFKIAENVLLDSDADGVPDYRDFDDDGDGMLDSDDACPIDPNPACRPTGEMEPRVRLFSGSGGFGGLFESTFAEVSFPYSSNGITNANVMGIPAPTTHTLGTFKLVAQGQNYTITDLRATSSSNAVRPFFKNIANDYLLIDGKEVEFELVSPLTRGATVNLNFQFKVRETGDTFSVSYTFKSN